MYRLVILPDGVDGRDIHIKYIKFSKEKLRR